jgi:hypothetical protein
MTAPKYIRAWWVFIDAAGRMDKDGRSLGAGLTADGTIWLNGQALTGGPVPMTIEAAEKLADHIKGLAAEARDNQQ